MNVELPETRGHSFMHTVLYVTHDKRAEGAEFHPQTADRVAWAETRNMGGVGPQTGWRMMLDTFRHRDALKAAAGVRKTKDATAGPVYHFSMNWHPDERGGAPSKAEMIEAAERVLKVMGAEHLQAVMTAHTDTGHPHLHVVLSLVCPETGRMHAIGRNKGYDLDRWSHEYEVEGGRIFSPDRAAKYAEMDRKKQLHPDKAERKRYVDDKKQQAANDRANEPVLSAKDGTAKAFGEAVARKLSEGAQLKTRADALKARQKKEREFAWRTFKAKRDAAWSDRPSFKAIAAQHRTDTRADWSAFGKSQAADRRAFRQNERVLFGALGNARYIVESAGFRPEMKGYLGQIFAWWMSSPDHRAAQFAQIQAKDKEAFAARMKADLDRKIQAAKDAHGRKLDLINAGYNSVKATMADRHDTERAEMSGIWKDYYERRDKAAALRLRGRVGSSYRRSTRPESVPAPQTPTQSVWQRAADAKKQQAAPDRKRYWDGQTKPTEKPRSRDDGKPRDRGPERSGPE